MDVITGLIGVLVGGLLTLAGSYFQSRMQLKILDRQFEQQRRLAQEAHEREQAVTENNKMRERLELHVSHGRKIMRAASMFERARKERGKDVERVWLESLENSGIDPDAPSPRASFLAPEEVQDIELSNLIADFTQHIEAMEFALIMVDPNELPSDCISEFREVDKIARQIEARWRLLQREGRPL